MKKHKPQILIIEDEADIRASIADLLELHGFNTHCAPDGASGITAAVNSPPDLVLCDVMMPGMDGFQTVEALRSQPGLRHLPIVFLTALTDLADHRKGMSSGADDYLYKPFEVKSLLTTIHTRLRRVEAIKSDFDQKSMALAKRIRHLEEMMNQYAYLNSHSLRGPLTRLLGLTRLLLEGVDIEEGWDRDDILKAIEQSTQEMDEIIHFMNHSLDHTLRGKRKQ